MIHLSYTKVIPLNFSLQYCVASNSLSALTYWCQGKPACKFQPSWLINSHLTSPNSALLYIHNQGLTSVQNYLDAVQSCQDSHNLLAKLDSKEAINQALELMSRINSSLKGFWIDAYTKEHFQDLDIHASGHMQDSCLVLLNDVHNVLKLQWESCYDAETQYGALCQVKKTQDFGDNSCFEELTNPVLEFRYHVGKNLNTHDVNCPMEEMLMRRGNTCYKTTDETDWNSARLQCWNWGGELAFLLPKDDPECRAPVPGLQRQEVKVARLKWILSAEKNSEFRIFLFVLSGFFKIFQEFFFRIFSSFFIITKFFEYFFLAIFL